MKTTNLNMFPSSEAEIGKQHERIDDDLLDRLTEINEEYTKNCERPIETFKETATSLIARTLNMESAVDRKILAKKKQELQHKEHKRIRSRNKEMEKVVKSETNL